MINYATSFGKAGDDYRKYRLGYPESLFEKLRTQGVGLPDQKLLDVGTGTGALACYFAIQGCKVIGTDVDNDMLKQAQAISENALLDIKFIHSSTESINLEPESQDVVTAGQCWHWFKLGKASREVFRLLKPEGTLVIAHYDWIPLKGNVVEETEQLVLKHNSEWPFHSGTGIHYYGLRALAESGFQNIESYSYDEPAEYNHEAWRGRMRASNGVTTMNPETAKVFDNEMKEMLSKKFPDEPMQVDHRVFYIIARKPK